jgi:hypothetical protein
MEDFRFQCTSCHEWHDGLPDIGFDAPLPYAELTDEEKETIATKSDDLCSIRDEDFFIRGVLMIPIAGTDAQFGWGVWVSLSRTNYEGYLELYDEPDPADEPSYFGWFCNRLPWYFDTWLLETTVHLRPYPERPRVELEPSDHLLNVHQRHGIDLPTLQEILAVALHPES